MVKGLVFFDYDGTLVDERDGIYAPTTQTIESVSKLQKNGYYCFLATGRALSYLPKAIHTLNLDGFVTSKAKMLASIIIVQKIFIYLFMHFLQKKED